MVYLTKKERILFTNREAEIEELNKGIELLKNGFPKNFSLIGLRKIGKTLLTKKFGENLENTVIPFFFNIEKNFSLPEDFALRFAYTIFYSLKPGGNYIPNLSELNRIKPKSKIADDMVNLFLSEYEKRKPNKLLLIQKAFELPDRLAKELNIKFVVFLDEFQAIIGLNNYKEIKNILGAIRVFFEHTENVMWVISGSAISLMLNITSDPKSSFFELFTNVNLDFFSKENTLKHINKIERMYNAKISSVIKEKIFVFTRGHPFYVFCITDKLCSISKEPLLRELTAAIFEEVLTPGARIYGHCKYVFDTSLEKAKGKATIKRVLEFLSINGLSTMTDIAKSTKMTLQTVNISLIRLKEVDIVERIRQQYRICDPVLMFWIKNTILGGEDFIKIKEARMKQIEQELLNAKTELGKAKEYEIKDKLEKQFGLKLDNYLKDKIELDLVGKKNDIYYIFEIKWRNKPTDYKDIKNFLNKIKKSEFKDKNKKLFFISKSGFTKQATDILKKNEIEIIEM